MSVYDTVAHMAIEVLRVTPPVAAYLPYVQTGNVNFISGTSRREIGTLQAAAGDLNRIARIVSIWIAR